MAEPSEPRAQPGYYPGYSTLSQKKFWDETTRKVVTRTSGQRCPPIRFFSPQEAMLMEAVCDHIIPQDDRDETHRIPIVNHIDKRLYENRLDGYRFENMPTDQEAHRLGLQAIEEIAQTTHGCGFLELGPLEQDKILQVFARWQSVGCARNLETNAGASLLDAAGAGLRRGLLRPSLGLG